MVRYVALYCRLSPRPDGSYEGVELQERWGRDYAASAWPDLPVEVFADKGISAANGDERPEFERFREWLVVGRLAHVWTVEQSRLERREVEWFRLAAEFDAAGVTEIHTNRDGVVRVRDEVAGIKAVLAAGEVRKLRKRVNDRLAENAVAGLPPGGRHFCYRHTTDAEASQLGYKTLITLDDRADAIRDVADKVLSGWSLQRLTEHLHERGFAEGAHGGKLTPNGLRRILLSPTLAALRVYRDRVVGKGNWQPVLDEGTWNAVRLRLTTPRTVNRSDGGTYDVPALPVGSRTARRYLLTGGTAVCGVCGAPLVGTVKQLRHKRPVPHYICHPKLGGRSCVGIMAEALENHVRDVLLDELDKPEFLSQLAVDNHAERRDQIAKALAGLEKQRNELAALWATPGELTAAEWQTARRALAEHEQRLRADLAALPAPVGRVDIGAAREAWPEMTLDERREIVGMFVERVTVNRARLGAQRPTPEERVSIEWCKR